MNNDEAMAELVAKRTAINAAINGLNLYVQQKDNWLAAIRTSHMTQVKANAATAGADIDAWDGTPAPDPEEALA